MAGGGGGSWDGGWGKGSQRCYHQRQAADVLDKRLKLREANPKTAKSRTGKDEDLPQI